MSTFSGDIGREEEDGGGWGGLVASKAELRAEAAAAKQAMEAKRWRFLATHWHSLMGGIPLHRWLDENALRHGSLGKALDFAIAYHESAERHIA